MLISHKKKFIFVHIYKTAGTSVSSIFLPYARIIDRLVFKYVPSRKIFSLIIKIMKWRDDGQKQFTGVHKHAPAIDIMNYLGKKRYHQYFKFVFVRNPFDLLVSLYYYVSQTEHHIDYQKVSKMSFEQFIQWYIGQNPPLQLSFIQHPDTGDIIVDYVGKFETLDNDLTIIQKKLDLIKERKIKHQNPSKKRKSKDYRPYYNDDTKKLVQSYFKKDLEEFHYTF